MKISFRLSRDITLKKDGRKEKNIIYLVFIPKQSHSECVLLPIAAHKKSACHIQRLTAQHIYCTNTVQTLQPANEVYLLKLHGSCCYMFSCTTWEKLPSWYLQKWRAGACFILYSHTHPEIRFFKLTLLAARAVSQFDCDKGQVDVTKVTDVMCKVKSNSDNFIFQCRFLRGFCEAYRILQ